MHGLASYDQLPPPAPGTASGNYLLDETVKQTIRVLTNGDSESNNRRKDNTTEETRGESEDEQSLD